MGKKVNVKQEKVDEIIQAAELENPMEGEAMEEVPASETDVPNKNPQDFDPIPPENLDEKLKIISAGTDSFSTTFQFNKEDHTLGNALRWAVAKDEAVEYVGYAIPHPSEHILNFRIQTFKDSKTTIEALSDGLDNLISMCDHMEEELKADFAKKEYDLLPTEKELMARNIELLKDTHLVDE